MPKPEDYGSVGFAVSKGSDGDVDRYTRVDPNEVVAVFENIATLSGSDEKKQFEDEGFSKGVEIIEDREMPGDRTDLILGPGQFIPLTRADMAGGFSDVRKIGNCEVKKYTEEHAKKLRARGKSAGGTKSFRDHLPEGHPNKKRGATDGGGKGHPDGEAGVGFPDDPGLIAGLGAGQA